MKKSEIQNDEASVEEIREEAGEEYAFAGERSKKKNALRRKSGLCGWKSFSGAVFSFLAFTLVLGAIGFGTVWLLDNGKSVVFRSDEKKSLSEAVKNAEEKISLNLESIDKDKKEEESPDTSVSEEKRTASYENAAKVPILVLNAGGAKGSAGKVADALKQAGFLLAKTGNASVFNYKGLTVYYSDDKSKTDAEAVSAVLKKSLGSATVVKASTADEKKEKIVVMVGE